MTAQPPLPPVLRRGANTDGSHDGARLLEYSTSANIALRVDRDKATICGVKVLGVESANGRLYPPEALRAAAALYENVRVNVDHLSGGLRSYRDRIGKLTNIRFERDGLYGDLVVNPKHPLAEQLFWDAEHSPESVGLSHDAVGKTSVRGGKIIVEAIHSVRSVDLVAEPATTKSLYESATDAVMATSEPEPDADTSDDGAPDDQEATDDPDRLSDDAFALVLPGGVKIRDKTHPLHKRYFPIHTPDAVKRALRAIDANRKLAPHHRALAMQKARDAARKFGIDPDTIITQKESRIMAIDLSSLTLAELKEARPDLIEAVLENGDRDKEWLALKEERDRLAAELEAHRLREKIADELREAEIALDIVPQSLRETLLATADDAARKKLIADLKTLIRNRETPRSVPSGAQPQPKWEDLVASWRI